MKLTAKANFLNRGAIVKVGQTFEVSEHEAHEYLARGLAENESGKAVNAPFVAEMADELGSTESVKESAPKRSKKV